MFEECGVDRPLRVRRLSLGLLAGGWAVFFVSCVAGYVLVRSGVPIRGWGALTGGETVGLAAWQWTRTIAEALGGTAFIAGLISVGLFDRRDNPPAVRARGR